MSNSFNNNEIYSNDNNSLQTDCEAELNMMISRIKTRMNTIEKNFNNLKKDLFTLTKQYETNKQNDKNSDKTNINSSLNNNTTNITTLYEDKIKEIFSSQREENINYITSSLEKFQNEDNFKLPASEIITHNNINILQSQCEQNVINLSSKVDNTLKMRVNTFNTMISEMDREFTSISSLIDENAIELISSNTDRAIAIRDMLKLFVSKFKAEKKEQNDFEEKILKLIDELCNKILLIKQQN